MSLEKNKLQYSKKAKLFHWGFVLLFVYAVSKQVDEINQLHSFINLIKFSFSGKNPEAAILDIVQAFGLTI